MRTSKKKPAPRAKRAAAKPLRAKTGSAKKPATAPAKPLPAAQTQPATAAPSAAAPLASEFKASIERLIADGAPWPAAVAVSGGADSVALMVLLSEWAKAEGKAAPVVLTVDHGLQADSAGQCEAVMRQAKQLGLKAHRLAWDGAKPKSDVEAAAREARYRLIGDWLQSNKLSALYLAHSEDDQAETFLLRLARGSGVDGLSAMRAVGNYPLAAFKGLVVVRPLLELSRSALREWLRKRKIDWHEDPMNEDSRYARVRIRKLWPDLVEAGLTPARIADAASHLLRAREALDAITDALIARAVRFEGLEARLDAVRLRTAPREVGLRALARVLAHVSGEAYRPRFERLERLFDSILADTLGGGATLQGCVVAPAGRSEAVFGTATLTIAREPSRRTHSD